MKIARLLELCSGYPYFDLAFLRQFSGENDATVDLNVSRWLANGTLVPLRRGMYTLAKHLRKAEIFTPRLANDLYPPSYLTDAWALTFYGLVPDVAREHTSATMRRPQRFVNEFGVFSYRHLDEAYFWGFRTVQTTRGECRCAIPEKALLDHWYWTQGEWTIARLRELRLQNLGQLDLGKLQEAVARWGKPRIHRAYRCLREIVREEES